MLHWLVIVALKAFVVLTLLLLGLLMTRRTASAVICLVIAVVLLCLPFLDVASGWVPGWHWQWSTLAVTDAFSNEVAAIDGLVSQGRVPVGIENGEYVEPVERGVGWWSLVVWGLGAIVVLARRLWRMLNVRLRYARSEPLAHDHALMAVVAGVGARAGGGEVPWLLMNPEVCGAQTSGVIRPYILLPRSFMRLGREEQEMILCHELAHIRRHDVLVRWLLEVVLILFWFHPLVWMVRRRYDLEVEKACDDAVLDAGYGAAGYSELLLKEVKDGPGGGAGAVRKRIESVLNPAKQRLPLTRRAAVGFVLMVCLGLAPVGLLGVSPYPLAPEFEPMEAGGEMRALWRMSMGRGSVVPDWSGHGCHGRVLGARWVRDEVRGSCLSFDGVDDHLVLRSPDADWTHKAFTLCVWLKPELGGDGGGLLLKGDNNQVWSSAVGDPKDMASGGVGFAEREISLAGGELAGGWQSLRTYQPGLHPTLNYYNLAFQRGRRMLRAGEWNHLAIVWQPDEMGGVVISMLLDGEPIGVESLYFGRLAGSMDWPTSVWYFGRGESPLTHGNHYEGLASDLVIYQRGLGRGEVERVMRGEFPL